ncbi:MAG: DNA repair protein RadA [Planctomycetes bacterium]|nr:DNA repair protein RadA [Planctomycetota bacterium]
MPRPKPSFCCLHCGHSASKRLGRCPTCGEWNCFEADLAPAADPAGWAVGRDRVRPLPDVPASAEERFPSGSREIDRVLGGGFVRGSAVLVGGDPGVGKSTLMLQAAERVARAGKIVLYLSGEESAAQVAMRARRIGAAAPTLLVGSGTNLVEFAAEIAARRPDLVIIDSIQTVALPEIPSIPGSLTQVRECAARLTGAAKTAGHALVLIGHVTKEGSVAGPRTLEHLVDAVLYLEGDRLQDYRLLRGVKNRFGSTGEIGIFEMSAIGLTDVANPSRYFLSRSPVALPGVVVTPTLVGTRTLLVDVQALTTKTGYGTPARRANGVDATRLAVLLAVLEKRAGLQISGEDVFVATAGGVKLEESSSDLAVALAVASAFLDREFPHDTAVVGEIGLGGEIRPCGPLEARVEEAARLGFRRVLVPGPGVKGGHGIDVEAVATIEGALERLGPQRAQRTTRRA